MGAARRFIVAVFFNNKAVFLKEVRVWKWAIVDKKLFTLLDIAKSLEHDKAAIVDFIMLRNYYHIWVKRVVDKVKQR